LRRASVRAVCLGSSSSKAAIVGEAAIVNMLLERMTEKSEIGLGACTYVLRWEA